MVLIAKEIEGGFRQTTTDKNEHHHITILIISLSKKSISKHLLMRIKKRDWKKVLRIITFFGFL